MSLGYLHDCCQCIYFALPPSINSEFDLSLPCDGGLWKASSSREWFEHLQEPSHYGSAAARLMGMNSRKALATLTEISAPAPPLHLPPFANFLLIHSILCNIYSHMQMEGAVSGGSGSSGADDAARENTALTVQNALHNWLQGWQSEPAVPRPEVGAPEPPFACDALPFYWLAQVSLLTFCQGDGPQGANAQVEVRFRLIKQWLVRIRNYLRRDEQEPTQLWDELMKVRLENSGEGTEGASADHPDGLLAFFPEH